MTRTPRLLPRQRLWRRLSLAIAVTLVVCAGCTEETTGEVSYTAKPRPPYSSDVYTSTRLILKRTDGGFEVVSSTPSFGGVMQPNVAEAMPEILDGRQRLYEYAARNRDGALVAQGYFTVPLTARATFTEAGDPERIHHVEIDDPSRLVRVTIPFVADLATVEFRVMVPEKDRRYENWAKEDAGSIRLEPSPGEQRQSEESQ